MSAGYFISNGTFDPSRRDQYNDLLQWLGKQPYDKIDEYAWQALKSEYIEKPVNIIQFLYDTEYMGKLYFNKGKSAIYKYWVDKLTKVFPTWFYTRYSLILASLAIGVGKTTWQTAMELYLTHCIGCLKNPAEHFGLLSTETIVLGLFSTTKDQLYQVNWPKYADALAISPWFKKRLNLSESEQRVRSLDLFDHFAIQIGSRTQHAIGRDVISCMIDEGNQEITSDQVVKNFNEIMKRRESRFQNGFTVPGVVCVASSPQGPDDFIYQCIQQYKNDPMCLILNDVSEWEVKEGSKDYCGKKFKIFLGDNKTTDPVILKANEDISNLNPALIREVPIEYYKEFETDLIGSIRDKLGLRSIATSALFSSRQQIVQVCDLDNLFVTDVIELAVFDSYNEIVRYVDTDILNYYVELGIPVNIGMDYGRTHDKFGMGIGYCIRKLEDDHYDREYFTFGAVSFKAKDAKGVPSKAIEDFIDWLSGSGLKISYVTSDKPGLVTLQNLAIKGFQTEYKSVDKPKDAYMVLRTLINTQRIHLPKNELLITELSNLQDLPDMVDHPKKMTHLGRLVEGSKDTADACCQQVHKSFLQIPYEQSASVVKNLNNMLESFRYQEFLEGIQTMNTIQNNGSNFRDSIYNNSQSANNSNLPMFANIYNQGNNQPDFRSSIYR